VKEDGGYHEEYRELIFLNLGLRRRYSPNSKNPFFVAFFPIKKCFFLFLIDKRTSINTSPVAVYKSTKQKNDKKQKHEELLTAKEATINKEKTASVAVQKSEVQRTESSILAPFFYFSR
jgi:hypothetical protein